jgi:hypothetical protein
MLCRNGSSGSDRPIFTCSDQACAHSRNDQLPWAQEQEQAAASEAQQEQKAEPAEPAVTRTPNNQLSRQQQLLSQHSSQDDLQHTTYSHCSQPGGCVRCMPGFWQGLCAWPRQLLPG